MLLMPSAKEHARERDDLDNAHSARLKPLSLAASCTLSARECDDAICRGGIPWIGTLRIPQSCRAMRQADEERTPRCDEFQHRPKLPCHHPTIPWGGD